MTMTMLLEVFAMALDAVLVLLWYLVYRAMAKIDERINLALSWNRHLDNPSACQHDARAGEVMVPGSRPEIIDAYLFKQRRR